MTSFRPLIVTSLVLAATPALAQPGAEPEQPPVMVLVPAPSPPPAPPAAPPAAPTTTAPQNEDWNNVNHINGQIVKVGEKGEYLIRYRKTNISTNPISWMFGLYGVSVSHAIHDNVAIRGDLNVYSKDGDTGHELGASLPIYFKRVYHGPFIEPGLIVRKVGEGDNDESGVGPSVVVGWHWTFDSGLNMAFAVGAMRNVNTKMDEFGNTGNDIQPSGYFRVGYAF